MNEPTQVTTEKVLGPAPGELGYAMAQPAPVVTVKDRKGRELKIRRLTALDRLRLFEALGPKLAENVMYVSYALSAACVVSIDGVAQGVPASKLQLETLIQRLDNDGLEAATAAHREHFEKGESGDPLP